MNFSKDTFFELTRYGISGATAVAVNLGMLYLFTDILTVWYVISAALAHIGSIFTSFFLHKYWTFKDDRANVIYKQFSLFILISILDIGLNMFLIFILVDKLGLWYLFAQAVIFIFIAVSNFIIFKIFIFRERDKKLS